MRDIIRYILLTVAILAPTCRAQEFWDEANFRSFSLGGLRLYGVTVYSSYSTTALPPTRNGELLTLALQRSVRNDGSYGANWAAGWHHNGAKSSFSLRYMGLYGGRLRYSQLNSFGHMSSFSYSRTLRAKWQVSVGASGDLRTYAQYVFQPTSLGVISQVPASFDDLAAAFSIGQYSGPQAASMLAGTQLMAAPERTLLMGDRVLTYQAQASATYQISSRLSLQFSSFTAGGQSTIGGQQAYLIPRTLGANAGVTMGYLLSPRTQFSLGVMETRSGNAYQASYGTSANASLGRKMSEHWFLSFNGGMSYSIITKQTYGSPGSRQVIGGGAIGYRVFASTLVASYNRTANDAYGIATGAVTRYGGSWNWHRPGSSWGIVASVGRSEIQNAGYTSLFGWHATAGFSRSLGSQVSMRAQYVYLNSHGTYLNFSTSRAVHSVRLSLSWGPQQFPRMSTPGSLVQEP